LIPANKTRRPTMSQTAAGNPLEIEPSLTKTSLSKRTNPPHYELSGHSRKVLPPRSSPRLSITMGISTGSRKIFVFIQDPRNGGDPADILQNLHITGHIRPGFPRLPPVVQHLRLERLRKLTAGPEQNYLRKRRRNPRKGLFRGLDLRWPTRRKSSCLRSKSTRATTTRTRSPSRKVCPSR